MKKIIIALAVTAMVHLGAAAQTADCKTRPAAKHAGMAHMQRHKAAAHESNMYGLQGQKASSAVACRVVPYEVCKINPDRRSVSCYKSVDPFGENPEHYSAMTTTYGPDGKMPGEDTRLSAKTIIVNAPAPPNYCKRNAANDGTICYSPGDLSRDDLGVYHYNFK